MKGVFSFLTAKRENGSGSFPEVLFWQHNLPNRIVRPHFGVHDISPEIYDSKRFYSKLSRLFIEKLIKKPAM